MELLKKKSVQHHRRHVLAPDRSRFPGAFWLGCYTFRQSAGIATQNRKLEMATRGEASHLVSVVRGDITVRYTFPKLSRRSQHIQSNHRRLVANLKTWGEPDDPR